MLSSFVKSILCSSSRKPVVEKSSWADDGGSDDESPPDNKKYLILDLDETLIHARGSSFQAATHTVIVRIEKYKKRFFVATRPHLIEFLEEMSKHYSIILFTASYREYAERIVHKTGIAKYFQKMLFRTDCKETWHGLTKDLSILGLPLKNVVLVDDSLENSHYQQDNILLIDPFEGKKTDEVLLDLIPFMKDLATHRDVRRVDPKYVDFLHQQRSQKEKEKSTTASNKRERGSKAKSEDLVKLQVKAIKDEVKIQDTLPPALISDNESHTATTILTENTNSDSSKLSKENSLALSKEDSITSSKDSSLTLSKENSVCFALSDNVTINE